VTIRLRLTLLYSALLALTLIVFGGVLYVTVERVTLGVVRATLEDEAQRLIDGRVPLRGGGAMLPVGRFGAPETYVQTRDQAGAVVDRTANLGAVTLPLAGGGAAAVRAGQDWAEPVELEGERFLVLSRPVVVGGRQVGTVQVARSLAEQGRALGILRAVLTVGGGLVVALAFAGGWALSGLALRPIHRLARAAQAIGAERSFARRLAYDGPRDELGRLAATFDEMLTALQAAYQQADEALQAQRRFVADASHELRTPLTTLRGNLGLLTREPPIEAEDRAAVLADMVAECDRLIRLVNDLLRLARGASRADRREVVPLRPLVEDVCRQAVHLAPGRTVEQDVPDLAAVADRDALRQILLIALDNAFRHTPPDAAVSVAAVEGGGSVDLTVRDRGPGIAPDALAHVTERFFRGDGVRSGGGAGLGLAIARALAESQGGAIDVDSRLGEGTTVRLRLPRPSLEPAALPPAA
jgi:two-component system OmpR family sensor kinase